MSLSKLKVALSNTESQLKVEKLCSLAKYNRMKKLEELIVKLGYDPNDCKAAEEIIKKKNAYIVGLQKQLKIPSTKDPQTKEMAENGCDKE